MSGKINDFKEFILSIIFLILFTYFMKTLVSGSIAYDYIMDFWDSFKNHIIPDKMHVLSVSFFTPSLRKEKWWTWHNIAYSMWLLWEKSVLLWAVWTDFLESSKLIDYSTIHRSQDKLTASCHIINDKDNNQISAFHPWAMFEAVSQDIPSIDFSYAIISPNDKNTMKKHLKDANKLWIKTFFDPGQQITNFNAEELLESLDYTNYLILNDYEYSLFLEKTWVNEDFLKNKLDKIIITLWKEWVKLIDKNSESKIDSLQNIQVLDPTWAWDSFRAWLIIWLNNWYSWENSCKIGTLLACYCIKSYWTQNHFFEKNNFEEKFKLEFWTEINL